MNSFLVQVILAARNRDTESWMQILVFVVIAVIYALSSIVKAKSNKAEQENEEPLTRKPPHKPPGRPSRTQTPPVRQVRRPVSPMLRTEYKLQKQPTPRKVGRPQPPAAAPAIQKQPTRQEPLEIPEMPEFSFEGPQLKTGIEELPDYTSETLQKMQAQAQSLGLGGQKPVVEVEDVSRPILDYADSDELTRAILHYEILGRPISLRDQSERVIGL